MLQSFENISIKSDDAVVRDLLRKAKALDATRSHPMAPQFDDLRDDLKKLLQADPNGVACWNTLPIKKRDILLSVEENKAEWQNELLIDNLKLSLKILNMEYIDICKDIRLNFEAILEHVPEEALFLFALFLDLSSEKTVSQNVARTSLEALSNKSEVSAAEIGKLTGDKIHFNMFTSGEFREQAFVRFKFPPAIRELQLLTENQDDEAAQALVTIQKFLAIVSPRAREDITQALFSLFMEKLVKSFNSSSDCKPEHAVASVTGMAPIDVEVTISKQYMEGSAVMRGMRLNKNAEMRDTGSNKRHRTQQATGDWKTTLTIKSDLVVFPISPIPDTCSSSEGQRQQFTHCDVNIEMKRFRLLIGKENKSPLTQVSAESYARKSKLDNPKVLYSVLTDCCGLYALIHVVKPKDLSDEYWISRQESDPKKIVDILRWLLIKSRSTDPPDLSSWKEETTHDQHSVNDEHAANDEHIALSQNSGDNVPDSNSASGRKSGEEENAGLTMEDVFEEDDDSEDEGIDWSHFYALQTQRQAGVQFLFTGEFLGS
jgi:hypothetical protein